jgi:cytochrome c peroxidase
MKTKIASKFAASRTGRIVLRRGALTAAAFFASGVSAYALISDKAELEVAAEVEETVFEELGGHASQQRITGLVRNGQNATAFEQSFDFGDELFGTPFTAADGGGANVGNGMRFTRMPRADKTGVGEWATHDPPRATGPNAMSCTGCHNQGADDGGGEAATSVHRDPLHTGVPNSMIQRNTPSVLGLGALQKLAEEMTLDLQDERESARRACRCGTAGPACTNSRDLRAKGINFGRVTVSKLESSITCTDTVDPPMGMGKPAIAVDLVVRAFQWKGSVATVREFVRDAANNELGMQAVEFLGSPAIDPATIDGDGDGVANEMTVGDITSLTIYQAAQARPTTLQELASLGLAPRLTSAQNAAIAAGSRLFDSVGCNSCHVRSLLINDPVFREPSPVVGFRDAGDRFPNGRSLLSQGLDISNPLRFDLTRDAIENGDVRIGNGQKLGALRRDNQGRAIAEVFTDLRRHDMGPGLAESVDETGAGASVFMTRALWGAGSTPPYMHDGRATTLTEAIFEHGGDAQQARANFVALSTAQKGQLVAFLKNLVLFKVAEEE